MPWETTGGGGIGLMNQTDFESYIEDQSSAETIANSPIAMGSIVSSKPAIDSVAASQTAMDAVAASETATDAVAASQTAMDSVAASQTAMDSVAASQTAIDVVTASQTAMDSVAASQVAMDKVAASQTAMDSVAASQVAMDKVAASQTAREAVNASNLAYDTISAVEMAIGKFVAGSAGLTPGDYADIAAVASSQDAMDAVSTSLLARSSALGSPYSVDSIWSENYASQRIWNEGTIDGTGTDTPSWIAPTFDLSKATTLKVDTEWAGYGNGVKVYIDGTSIFSNGNDHSWTTRSLDVSTYDGDHTIELEYDRDYDNTEQLYIESGTGNGVAIKFYQTSYENSRYGNFRNLRFE